MKKFAFSFAVIAVFLVVGVNNLFAQARLAGRFGEAMVGGRRVMVHVTVAVPHGWDENAVAENALRDHGARPLRRSEFSLEGIHWDQFADGAPIGGSVSLNYNLAGQPVDALQNLMDAEKTWNDVSTSKFAFSYGGQTNRCPSLVAECPGPQTFDGNNDVGWVAISGCCTLGVTWFGTGIDEADTALNSRFTWNTTGTGSGFDVQTVLLHEIGHTLGLGHSSVTGAVMEATYGGARRILHEDDERGVTYLYPETGATGPISGFVTSAVGAAAISGANITIAGLPVSATSAANGQYTLSGVPNIGLYSITATATGYNSQTLNDVQVGPIIQMFTLTVKSGSGSAPCVPKSPNSNKCR